MIAVFARSKVRHECIKASPLRGCFVSLATSDQRHLEHEQSTKRIDD